VARCGGGVRKIILLSYAVEITESFPELPSFLRKYDRKRRDWDGFDLEVQVLLHRGSSIDSFLLFISLFLK